MGAFSCIRRECVKPFLAPFTPEDEFEELCWQDGELVLLVSAQDTRNTKRLRCSAFNDIPVNDDQNSSRKNDHEDPSVCHREILMSHAARDRDAIKGRWDMNVAAAPSFPQDISDDEMGAWLHYPELQPAMYPAASCLPPLTAEQKNGDKQCDALNHGIGSVPITGKPPDDVDMAACSTKAAAALAENHHGILQTESSIGFVRPDLFKFPMKSPCSTPRSAHQKNPELASRPAENARHRKSAQDDSERLNQTDEGIAFPDEPLRGCLQSPYVLSGQRPLDAKIHITQEFRLASDEVRKHARMLPERSRDILLDIDRNRDNQRSQKIHVKEVKRNNTSTKCKDPTKQAQNAGKRNRTPGLHNQAEKKRRDKINEKLKTLQNLIPNANKTAMASVLDDAIEYLKSLQSQISMMSHMNGITIPVIHGVHAAMHAAVHGNTGMMDKSIMGGAHIGLPLPSSVVPNNATSFPRHVIANAQTFPPPRNPSHYILPVNPEAP